MGYQAALIVLSIIAIILLVPPLIWHIRTLNIPAITLIVWLLLMDLKTFIDAIIWGGPDFQNSFSGVGYCDVMVKLQVGASVGICSSVAAIMFNLYRILKADTVIPGLRSFRKIAVDLSISLITPILVMSLNYLVQARRFYVFQYSGCQNIMAPSYLTILICTMWLVIWSIIGAVYAVLIIFNFFKKRKDVKDILRCTNSGLNLVRFAKLLIFCCIVILVMFPVSIYVFVGDISNVVGNYNFKKIHAYAVWSTIAFVPLNSPTYNVWIYISLSYVVFIFFGLGSDAIEMYLDILSKVGFSSAIQYIREKKERRRMLTADKTVSDVLKIGNITTATSTTGTNFDVELQQIIDGDSPVSNVFSDKNVLHTAGSEQTQLYSASSSIKFKTDFDPNLELDEEDVQYLKLLYQNKDHSTDKREKTRKNDSGSSEESVEEVDVPQMNYKFSIEH